MTQELQGPGNRSPGEWLDKAEVLRATVEQLRKDLSMDGDGLPLPEVGEEAFEQLRASVLPRLDDLHRSGVGALQAALYRVDIPEAHLQRTMAAGGLHTLAGECVLRALQKVLTRERFAGRF